MTAPRTGLRPFRHPSVAPLAAHPIGFRTSATPGATFLTAHPAGFRHFRQKGVALTTAHPTGPKPRPTNRCHPDVGWPLMGASRLSGGSPEPFHSPGGAPMTAHATGLKPGQRTAAILLWGGQSWPPTSQAARP